MITAKDANERTVSIRNEIHSNQLNQIEDEILKKIKCGEFQLYFYNTISKAVVDELKRLGYDLEESHDQREGYVLKISWK